MAQNATELDDKIFPHSFRKLTRHLLWLMILVFKSRIINNRHIFFRLSANFQGYRSTSLRYPHKSCDHLSFLALFNFGYKYVNAYFINF